MKYVLFNPLAHNKDIQGTLDKVNELIKEKKELISLINLDLKDFVSSLKEDDEIYLVGGDGTINCFVNDLEGNIPKNNIYLFAGGTGNDFVADTRENDEPFYIINKYLVDLPKVKVNGLTRYFINGVGYGIDGYCCEVGEAQKKKSNKPVNYTAIAIKGLLFKYKNTTAKVEVDGKVYEHKHVWLCPTMKGRYYGGGMKVAPDQDRSNNERLVSNVIYKTPSKLKALMVFPSIFKGEHIKNKKVVQIVTGKNIKVTFNRPTALQIDGEVVPNVLSYEVEA